MRLCMFILAPILAMAGCSGGTGWYQPLVQGSPTGNLGMELDLTNSSEQQYARYIVRPDGTILFWGGQDAILDQVTWKGTLDADAGKALDDLVRTGDWFTHPPRGDGIGEDVWTITVLEPGRRRDFTVHGHAMHVDEAWAVLQSASSERFKDVLDALPRPNIERLNPSTTPPTNSESEPGG